MRPSYPIVKEASAQGTTAADPRPLAAAPPGRTSRPGHPSRDQGPATLLQCPDFQCIPDLRLDDWLTPSIRQRRKTKDS